jgi:hypothetical protein
MFLRLAFQTDPLLDRTTHLSLEKRSLTSAFQPRRLMIAPAADGCKRLLDSRHRSRESTATALTNQHGQIAPAVRAVELPSVTEETFRAERLIEPI